MIEVSESAPGIGSPPSVVRRLNLPEDMADGTKAVVEAVLAVGDPDQAKQPLLEELGHLCALWYWLQEPRVAATLQPMRPAIEAAVSTLTQAVIEPTGTQYDDYLVRTPGVMSWLIQRVRQRGVGGEVQAFEARIAARSKELAKPAKVEVGH